MDRRYRERVATQSWLDRYRRFPVHCVVCGQSLRLGEKIILKTVRLGPSTFYHKSCMEAMEKAAKVAASS